MVTYWCEITFAQGGNPLSIRGRMELREKLQCKPFKWYLEHVYPELKVPGKDVIAFGVIRQRTMCIDNLGNDGRVGLFTCHNFHSNQQWALTKSQQLKHLDMCLALVDSAPGNSVKLYQCNSANSYQKWQRYNSNNMLRHMTYDLCLDSIEHLTKGLTAEKCDTLAYHQQWHFTLDTRL